MKKSANNKFNVFSWLKEIFINKSSWDTFTEEQIHELNPFLINKFISMNKKYVELVNFLQTVNYQDKEQYYKICCNLFPKDYKYYAPYIKKKTTNVNQDLKITLSKYYQCSTREIEDYLDILEKDYILDILNEMSINDKEIKKLLK
jgi:hypothetical protein